MTYKLFAAIHAGSEEVSMKIYEISKRNGIRLIDTAVHYTELGSDTYLKGFIGYELANELCEVLEGFKLKLKEYQITDYTAYASSAIAEAGNKNILIDRIRLRTGITLIPIDNSEQFFLRLRSIALQMPNFRQLTEEGAAIVDMGGGSLQLTVYDKGKLIFTQNVKLGSLRLREILADLEGRSTDFVSVMNDYIGNDIDTLSKLFMIDHHVRHLILGGGVVGSIRKIFGITESYGMKKSDFNKFCDAVISQDPDKVSEKYSIPYELATQLVPAVLVYRGFADISGAEKVWSGNSDLCMGMASDYAERSSKVRKSESLNEDIIAYARAVADKYDSNTAHINNVETLGVILFDAMKKQAGLTERDRLLFRMACLLHDCGKYINMTGSIKYSCFIVLATEFPGLSGSEKNIVADAIRYNSYDHIPSIEELEASLNANDYIRMLKLTAILRLANAMDLSHRQKFSRISTQIKGQKIIIKADTIYDITLEQNIMKQNGSFFEEIFGYMPVLRSKRR